MDPTVVIELISIIVALAIVVVVAKRLFSFVDSIFRQAAISTSQKRTEHLIERVCHKHRRTLASQYRSKVYFDVYGKPVFDGWMKEVKRFTRRVVLPELEGTDFWSTFLPALTKSKWRLRKRRGIVDPADLLLDRVLAAANKTIRQEPALPSDELLKSSSGPDFEQWCASVLNSNGWTVSTIGGAGDQGIDLIGERNGRRCGFQCKNHATPVSNKAVQEAHTGAAVHGLDVAAVVSRKGFRDSARKAASATNVMLLTPEELADFSL